MSRLLYPAITLRDAQKSDAAALLGMVRDLATYERMPPEIAFTTEAITERLLSETSHAKALLAEIDNQPVGFAIYYFMHTFFAVRWMVIEAMYVAPALRQRGVGRRMMQHLAYIAVDEQCARIEWSVLDWNGAAAQFYETLGAQPQSQCRLYRLSGDAMRQLANPSRPPRP